MKIIKLTIKKLTAISFILIILSGNFILINNLLGVKTSKWIEGAFFSGTILALFCAIMYVLLFFYEKLTQKE
ncbi:MAG: hypothetical protein CMP11_08655 [Zetaproteobacteria bacterium]|nr:hypothetical protein [Pseudobdellovibrionaceae bacterium]